MVPAITISILEKYEVSKLLVSQNMSAVVVLAYESINPNETICFR